MMADAFAEAGRVAEFFVVTKPDQIDGLARQALARAKAAGGIVVAAGGDGTINAVAGIVLGSGCPFGVVPRGTFNYFGRTHAIPQDTEAAARALLGASVVPVQVGLLNGKVFLVNASLGLYPQLLEDREAWKKKLGRSRTVAFFAGLSTLLQVHRQFELRIEFAGISRVIRTPTLFVGNNQLQLSRVGLHDGVANAVVQGRLAGIAVRQIGTWALFGLLIRGLLGRLGDDENIESFSFRRLSVSARRKKRLKVALDGEVMWMQSPLVFELAEHPLLLMVPAPADRAEIA